MFISRGIVRKGDYCLEATPHVCIGGSSDVFANSKPICCKGDEFTEEKKLIQGSKTVFANNHGVGRIGDAVSCGSRVASGSSNVFSE